MINTKLNLINPYAQDKRGIMLNFIVFSIEFCLEYFYLCFLGIQINYIIFSVLISYNRIAVETCSSFIICLFGANSIKFNWPRITEHWKYTNEKTSRPFGWKNILFLNNPLVKHSTYDRILGTKKGYGELYSICQLINANFEWSILDNVT